MDASLFFVHHLILHGGARENKAITRQQKLNNKCCINGFDR